MLITFLTIVEQPLTVLEVGRIKREHMCGHMNDKSMLQVIE
jgi:hypothetical protein